MGETVTLTAAVLPGDATNRNVTWSSSNNAVASVTNGVVTAVGKGTATITVTTVDGGKTATCTVTVNDPIGDVETLISQIGTVTLERKGAIDAARAAYDVLTDDQKAYATGLSTLIAAEKAYADLKAVADKEAVGRKAAADVDAQIAAIGTVTLNSKNTIDSVRAAYNALTADQKAYVQNLDVLEAAEAQYKKPKDQQTTLIELIIAGASNPKLPFTDVSKADWFYDEVNGAWQAGLINGMTETTFEPNGNLTVAQAIKLAAALHQRNAKGKVYLENGTDLWYSTYVQYAVDNGIIEAKYQNYSAAQMNAAATRAEFVHILHGAVDYYKWINSVADNAIPDVKSGSLYAAEIYELYRAGILTGSDAAGTFYPTSSIKRSEVAAILIRMFDKDVRQSVNLG